MVASMRSGNHRAIMSLIDSSSIPRDRKQAELSLKSVDPYTSTLDPFLLHLQPNSLRPFRHLLRELSHNICT
jgi:hypothetical protein